VRQRLLQDAYHQSGIHCLPERPANHSPGVGIQNDGQVDELFLKPNEGEIG